MKHIYLSFLSLTALVLTTSCNTDGEIRQVEGNILGTPLFTPKKDSIALEFNNIKVSAIQTNSQNNPILGQLTQGSLGTTNVALVTQALLSSANPTFGEKTQEQEASSYNENETVEKVYLYLPFFSTEKNIQDPSDAKKTIKTYTLDSIYGGKEASFTMKVEQLNHHLRDINSQLESQVYYSNEVFPTAATLAEVTVAGVSNNPIVRYQFDDPTTQTNEATKEKDRLAPGYRIELSPTLFQSLLLDKEGDSSLSSNDSFRQALNGLVISTANFSSGLLALINLKNAKIEVVYNYQFQKDNNTYTKKKSYELSLGGISFNQYTISDDMVSPSQDAIYLKGGQGYVAELTIPESNPVFHMLKAKKPIINQADLYLYVDKTKVDLSQQPPYVLIYNATKGLPLYDYSAEISGNTSSNDIVSIGRLTKDSKGDYYYHFYLTDHLTSLVKNGSDNVKIGLAVSTHLSQDTKSTISAMRSISYKNSANEVKKTVLGNAENTLYTVVYGNGSHVAEGKKLKLMVYYTLTE
jgi:hypothetical protein